MAAQWHYTKGGERHGPVSSEQLKQLAASGQVQPSDLVWRDGMGEWQKASAVKGLFPPQTSGPTEPPPIPQSQPQHKADPAAVTAEPAAGQSEKRGLLGTLSSLGRAAKTAAVVAAKEAERTKINNIDLPKAYAALGRDVHGRRVYREEFSDLYRQIDDLMARLRTLEGDASKQSHPPASFADKAKAAALATKKKAEAQAIGIQLSRLMSKLGEAVFERHGTAGGSPETTGPIATLLSRASMLANEVEQQRQASGGRVITRRRVVVAAVVACIGIALLIPAIESARQASPQGSSSDSLHSGAHTLPNLSEMLKTDAPRSEQTAQERVQSSTAHNDDLPNNQPSETVKVVIGTPSPAPRKTIDQEDTADWSGTFAYLREPVRVVESKGSTTDLFFVHKDKFVVVGGHTLYRTDTGKIVGTMEGGGEYRGLLVFAPNEQRAFSPIYSANNSSVAVYEFSNEALHLRQTYDLGSKARWSNYMEWAPNSKVIAVSAEGIGQGTEGAYCCAVLPIDTNGGGLIDSKSVKTTYIECPKGMSYGNTVGDIVLSPDGSQVAIKFTGPERGGAVGVFDTSTGRRLATLPMVTFGGGTSDIGVHGFSSDGKTLVTSYRAFSRTEEHKHNVTAWDTAGWKPTWRLEYPAVFVRFGPKEGQISTCSGIPSIDGTSETVWDLTDGRKLGTTVQARTHYFENAAHTLGLELMADGTLEVWDLKKNKIKAVLGQPDGHERCRLDISSDGRYVVSALHDDNAFEMWDTTVANATADLAAYKTRRPRRFSAGPQQQEDTSNTTKDGEWVEIDGNLFSASSLPPHLRRKAPPVSKSLYEQLRRGMQPQEVWKLFGGRPAKDGFDSFQEGKVMGGVYFEGISMRASQFEFYPGNGGPGSGVLLFYNGDRLPPPLVDSYQVKLK